MYGFSINLQDTFDNVVQGVTKALKTEGFGVLTTIDVKATLKEKLNIERRPYLILGACNPQLAHRVLEIEPDIGLLLPCNVVIREEPNGSITVSFMDPLSVLNIVNNPKVTEIAQEVRKRLEKVRDSLST
ncbi:MAG TPA: DUF302 domain-containing protein [Candidatus Babeliales bacterium]|nr:DUF302 domain-containing protein [Candidatus Babeliales bacterium]